MKIALDATYSVGEALSGVGVYSREILRGLATAHPEARFRWCYRPHRLLRSFKEKLPSNAARRVLSYSRTPGGDLFHALNQRVEIPRGLPVVTTFHDLFVLTAEYSSPEFRARFAEQARRAAERSDIIIAVSRFTADQVRDLLGVDEKRLRVIPHGTHPPSPSPVPDAERENLVLLVGAIQTRKNLVRLIDAFESLDPSWRLVLAGSQGFGSEAVVARATARVEIAGYVDAARLEGLYRRARIVAFPSLDEGFGIPVIEAMARGVPVLTSNGSALREVAGDAALLVDPLNTESIANGLRQLASDEALRQRLRAAGLARASEFTWDRAVDATWQVYGNLLTRSAR